MLKKLFSIVFLSLLICFSGYGQKKSKAIQKAAEPAPVAAAAPVQHVFYNIRQFGATGDGKTLDSPAINKAIDQCAADGGGTVYFPAGNYLSGSIRLKSNINLFLDAGSRIVGAPQEMNAYDPSEPFEGPAYQDGGHNYFHNSLIWGENLSNVSITGTGMIDGGGLERRDGPQDAISGYAAWGKPNYVAPAVIPDISTVRLGNKAIALKLCKNVLLRDFSMFHGGHFAILATGCERITFNNLTIDTNRDGIDIDCCKNFTVSDCRINSPQDDGLCLKSSYALGRKVICENGTITNCQVSGFVEGTLLDGTMKWKEDGTGRIKFGTESNGGYRNITVSNCTFRSCRGLALEEVDGGIMENITISNIAMMDVALYPIFIVTGKRNRGPNVTSVSTAKNILVSNIVITGMESRKGIQSAIQINGLPEQPIDGLRLENIRITYNGAGTAADAAIQLPDLGIGYPEVRITTPAYGVYAQYVKNLELANIHVSYLNEDLRPPMICKSVEGLEIENFKAQVATGVEPAKFENVQGLVVRNSPLLEPKKSPEVSPKKRK